MFDCGLQSKTIFVLVTTVDPTLLRVKLTLVFTKNNFDPNFERTFFVQYHEFILY